MYGSDEIKDMTGDLRPFARDPISLATDNQKREIDLFETWDAWNLIRTVCKYNSRLSVGKKPIQSIFHILCGIVKSEQIPIRELRTFGALFLPLKVLNPLCHR